MDAKMLSELEPEFRLLAVVYRQAVRDAQRGDRQAADWLDETAPGWRHVIIGYQHKKGIKPHARGGKTICIIHKKEHCYCTV